MTVGAPLKAPFQWFGGKSSIAAEVWTRFGDCPGYVEPFFGSGAVLLSRPADHTPTAETVNDADGLLANFWRATQRDPEAVAHHADWPVSECDLHARHAWLCGQREDVTRRLEGDPDWYDAKSAGWWVWGLCQWIGGGWCASEGPWRVVNGELLRVGGGQKRQLPHLGDAGVGINRQLPHLGNAGRGINRKLHDCMIQRRRPALGRQRGLNSGHAGTCAEWSEHLRGIMQALADRLRRVRICCGDWTRVCGPTPTIHHTVPCAVFLDPPYDIALRSDCYATETDCSAAVREWAIEHGDDPRYRIALCGYDVEHGAHMPENWDAWHWKAHGGYGAQGDGRGRENAGREVVWFSPHCIRPGVGQLALFGGDE